jgi:hypothetical protein
MAGLKKLQGMVKVKVQLLSMRIKGYLKMEGVDCLVCSLCGTRSPSTSSLLSHLRLVHVSDSNISLPCPVGECNATYSKVNSLCSHVYRKHKAVVLSTPGPAPVENSGASSQEDLT